MALVRWEPFREVSSLQKEFDRLMSTLGSMSYPELREGAFIPAVELEETDEAVDVKMELPGMTPDDIDIQVSADSVAISGERKTETSSEENGIKRSEFHYGSFRRTIPLPGRVDNAHTRAEYKDGILKLHLPKAPEERNKVVKVKVG